jgi:RPA family protein
MSTAYIRDPARSILATEFANIKETSTINLEDGKTKNITTTELNTNINRIFVAGILSEIEDIGSDKSYIKAKILCKTGSFTLYAGDYQPEAVQFLMENMKNLPVFVAVVGKINVYEPEQGKKIASIRPETITLSDETTRNYWLSDAANYLDKRLANPSFPEEHREKYKKEVQEIRAFLKESLPFHQAIFTGELKPSPECQISNSPLPQQDIPASIPTENPIPTSIPPAMNQNPSPVSAPAPIPEPSLSNVPVPDDLGSSVPANSPSGLTEDEDTALSIILKLSGNNGKIVSTAAVIKEMNLESIKVEAILKSLVTKGIITKKVPAFIEPPKGFSNPASA